MYIKKTLYNITNNCNYKFNMTESYLTIYNDIGIFYLKLPFFYFFKSVNDNLSFIFVKYFHFITFLKHIMSFVKKLNSIYMFKLRIKGLGYRIARVSKFLVQLFFSKNNIVYFHVPKSIMVKNKYKNLILIGTNINIMRRTLVSLLFLRQLIVYELKGIYYPKEILSMKPGKVKIR